MKRDALAFFRILPAGAADVGEDVSREDLREAGAGEWFVADRIQDDVSCIFGPPPAVDRPAEISSDYDIPLPLGEAPPQLGARIVELRFRGVG